MVREGFKHHSLYLISVVGIALAVFPAVNAQQTGEKLVRVNQVAQIHDAVLISDVSVEGKTVQCGLFIKPPDVDQPVTPFQASNDWLQHMTISLVNRTNKVIVFGGISFSFIDTGDCRALPCVGAALHFGRIPPMDAYDGRTGRPLNPELPERPALAWEPEQTIVLHVSDYMAKIEERLADSMQVANVTRVNVNRDSFYFADGTRWSLGNFYVPDPEHPGKFKKLPNDYFPGMRGHNWPPGYNN